MKVMPVSREGVCASLGFHLCTDKARRVWVVPRHQRVCGPDGFYSRSRVGRRRLKPGMVGGDAHSMRFKRVWRLRERPGTSSAWGSGPASLPRKRGSVSSSFGLNGRWRPIGPTASCCALSHSLRLWARCQPDAAGAESPSKKQLSAIIATYK